MSNNIKDKAASLEILKEVKEHLENDHDNETLFRENGKLKVKKSKVMDRINVLDYGIKNDGVTDNTEKLNKMFETIPWGSVVYFPVGVYNISGQISLPRTVTLIGESVKVQANPSSNILRNESQIVYVGNSSNLTLFVRTGSNTPISVKGISFYSNTYQVSDNTEPFTTLPYPYFKEETILENVNCLKLDNGGNVMVDSCTFTGFSGYALAINDHKYIKNCGFHTNKIGVKVIGTDSLIQNCWFSHGGIGILVTDSDNWTFSNLSVSDCWCDQMAEHFIKSELTGSFMLLMDNAWVDMIDRAAIYVMNLLVNSRINGRLSRCGMSYAGVIDDDKTKDMIYMSDAIVAKQIYDTNIGITIQKRTIGKGNNSNGICCSKAVSTYDNITQRVIITSDGLLEDLVELGSGICKVTGNNGTIINHNIWKYEETPILWRTTSPVGKAEAPYPNCLSIDANHGHVYYSTSQKDKNAWVNLLDKYISNQYVTPEMFGAIGDGVTDDTEAFEQACSKKNVLISKKYKITQSITLYKTVITANNNNAEIICAAEDDFSIVLNGYSELRNLKISGKKCVKITSHRNKILHCNFIGDETINDDIAVTFNYSKWFGENYILNNYFNKFYRAIDCENSEAPITDNHINDNIFVYGINSIVGTLGGCFICNNHDYSSEGMYISVANCLIDGNYFDNKDHISLNIAIKSGSTSIKDNLFYSATENDTTCILIRDFNNARCICTGNRTGGHKGTVTLFDLNNKYVKGDFRGNICANLYKNVTWSSAQSSVGITMDGLFYFNNEEYTLPIHIVGNVVSVKINSNGTFDVGKIGRLEWTYISAHDIYIPCEYENGIGTAIFRTNGDVEIYNSNNDVQMKNIKIAVDIPMKHTEISY